MGDVRWRGQLSGDLFQEVFGDVEGWDLQHCRPVHWKVPNGPTVISGLTRGTLKADGQGTDAWLQLKAQQLWWTGQDIISLPIPPEPQNHHY